MHYLYFCIKIAFVSLYSKIFCIFVIAITVMAII